MVDNRCVDGVYMIKHERLMRMTQELESRVKAALRTVAIENDPSWHHNHDGSAPGFEPDDIVEYVLESDIVDGRPMKYRTALVRKLDFRIGETDEERERDIVFYRSADYEHG